MRLIVKTTAAVALTVAVIALIGFISSVRSLSVGQDVSFMNISVERTGYAIYMIRTPMGSAKLSTVEAERMIGRISDVTGIYRLLLPETARALLGKH